MFVCFFKQKAVYDIYQCDCFFFFFFKQKTAYEIYQCDWSSDVCSSDLAVTVSLIYGLLFLVQGMVAGLIWLFSNRLAANANLSAS